MDKQNQQNWEYLYLKVFDKEPKTLIQLAKLQEMVETIPARNQKILHMHFGLSDGNIYTLKEIGAELGISRQRVKQVEDQCLELIRYTLLFTNW